MARIGNDEEAASSATSRLARLLRHEVGDLLQSVYSTTAILLDRLPGEQSLERHLLSEMKGRAEVCRFQLDAALELVLQPPLTGSVVDLLGLVTVAVAELGKRFPKARAQVRLPAQAFIQADPRALGAALSLLLLALGQGAKAEVGVEVEPREARVELRLRRDGFAVSEDQLKWIEVPFATTQQALFGMALALIARVARHAGGEIEASNPPEGGVCVRIQFPAHAAA